MTIRVTEDTKIVYFWLYDIVVFVIAVFILTLRQLKKASREDRPVGEVTIDAQ